MNDTFPLSAALRQYLASPDERSWKALPPPPEAQLPEEVFPMVIEVPVVTDCARVVDGVIHYHSGHCDGRIVDDVGDPEHQQIAMLEPKGDPNQAFFIAVTRIDDQHIQLERFGPGVRSDSEPRQD